MSTEPAAARCRQCGSRLRPGAEWCSLCLTPVREPEPPAPARPGPPQVPTPAQAPAPSAQVPAPSARVPGPDAVRTRVPVDPQVIAVADRMLAELALDSAGDRDSGLHRLLNRTADRTGMSPTGAGLALAAAGAGGLMTLLVVVLTILGLAVRIF